MKRLACTAAALALLAAAALAQGEKTPSVKEIMTKANKPNGLYFNLSKELKDDEPMWDEIQKETKELAKLATALGKNEPTLGPKDSWSKLTKDYADNAKALDEAAQKKDLRAVQTAHAKLGGGACMSCHKVHRVK